MKTVLFDVDTQIDFLFPAGALYVPGSERIFPLVAKLNHWAAGQGIPVISTVDAHAENDPEFGNWPPHCVVGTLGQRKPEATLLERRVSVPSHAANVDVAGAQQILLEKQSVDCFTNANLHKVLDALEAERCLVFGVVTEICVKNALFGLLKTRRQVELVGDVTKSLNREEARAMAAEFRICGGLKTSAAAVMK
jgi:nicotinamidase/pyrazinamidase